MGSARRPGPRRSTVAADRLGFLGRRGCRHRWSPLDERGGLRVLEVPATVVVTPHVDAQIGDGLDADFAATVTPRATIDDLDRAGTILLWGPDLKEEFPVLYLRVRRAAPNSGRSSSSSTPGVPDSTTSRPTRSRTGPAMGPDVLRKLAAGEGEYAGAPPTLGERSRRRSGRASPASPRTRPRRSRRSLCPGSPRYARILPLIRRGNVFGALDMGVAPTPAARKACPSTMTCPNGPILEDRWGTVARGIGKDAAEILRVL